MTVLMLKSLSRQVYDNNPEIKAVLDTLVDGTFSDGGAVGEGSFAELYTAILNGTAWHDPDHYFLLLDLQDYVDTKIKGNKDYQDRTAFV